ncbi:ribonuclease Z, partial [Bacillus spizizenii]|nr:ribonuclease Z [Bacillus spizizenii]
EQAAVTAKEAGVKKLILTHISARYQGDASLELQKEAADVFPNSVAAYDFLEVSVPRG